MILDIKIWYIFVTYNFCMIPHSLTFCFNLGHFGLKNQKDPEGQRRTQLSDSFRSLKLFKLVDVGEGPLVWNFPQ